MTGVKMHGRGHDKGYVIARDMTGVKMHGRGHDKGYVMAGNMTGDNAQHET